MSYCNVDLGSYTPMPLFWLYSKVIFLLSASPTIRNKYRAMRQPYWLEKEVVKVINKIIAYEC